MTHIAIRAATVDDLDDMVAVEIAAARQFPLEILPADIGRRGSRDEAARATSASLAWIAEDANAEVVGFLIAMVEHSFLHVVEMDVLPSRGRRGVGGALLEAACARAKCLELDAITLTTFESVPWNAPFYAKHGFEVVRDLRDLEHLCSALADEQSKGLKDRVAMIRYAA